MGDYFKMKEMTGTEKLARSILDGEQQSIDVFLEKLDNSDRKFVLPICFVWKALFHELKKNATFLKLLEQFLEVELKKEDPDSGILGNFIALLSLHDFSSVPRYLKDPRILNIKTILECLVDLRFVVYSCNEILN